MKHKNRKQTAATRSPDSAPELHRCPNPGCRYKGARYALKLHKDECRHNPARLLVQPC